MNVKHKKLSDLRATLSSPQSGSSAHLHHVHRYTSSRFIDTPQSSTSAHLNPGRLPVQQPTQLSSHHTTLGVQSGLTCSRWSGTPHCSGEDCASMGCED